MEAPVGVSAEARASPLSRDGLERVSARRGHALEGGFAGSMGLLSHAGPFAQARDVATENNTEDVRRLARAAAGGGNGIQDISGGLARLVQPSLKGAWTFKRSV